jgi:predicted dehydrogenase
MRKTVRVGVIGTSWWANWMYLPSLRNHPNAELAAICGRDLQRAGELAKTYGASEVFADYREMIAAGSLDAVVVAAPDDLHHPMTMAALDAGLHVLCEKPIANNAALAKEMYEKAQAADVKHMILFTWRWQPHFALMKKLVDEGFVGRFHHARFSFVGGEPRNKSYRWRFDARRANGVAGDIGSHMIDFARWYMGDIRRVSARLETMNVREGQPGASPSPANDAAFLLLEMSEGAHAVVELSQIAHLGDQEARISVHLHGDAGTLEAETIFFGAEGGSILRGIRHDETRFRTLHRRKFAAEFSKRPDLLEGYDKLPIGPRLFIEAIAQNKSVAPNFWDGLKAQEVVDAAFQSDAEGRWVSVG